MHFKLFKHLHTVFKHKRLVMIHCFKCGLYYQGIVHDLSKFSPTEFIPSVKYYQGNKSPNEKERELFGYSKCWLHHKGRNKHHWEYWNDYGIVEKRIIPVEMPKKYVIEMFCDRVAASKTYNGKAYKQEDAWNYYSGHVQRIEMHEKSREILEKYLKMLATEGEEATFKDIRSFLKVKGKK